MSSSGFSSRFASAPRERVSLGPRPPAASSRPPPEGASTPFAGFGVGVGTANVRASVSALTGVAPVLSDTGGDTKDVTGSGLDADVLGRDRSLGAEQSSVSPGGGALAPPPRSPPPLFSRDRIGVAGNAGTWYGGVGGGLDTSTATIANSGWTGLASREVANSAAVEGPPLSSQERLATLWAKADRESEALYFKSRGISEDAGGNDLMDGVEDTKPAGRSVGGTKSAVASVAESLSSTRFPGGFTSKAEPHETNLHGESNNLVALLCIDVSEHDCCGSAVGSSGKFCVLPKHLCKTKSHHKKGPTFLDKLKAKGMGRTLFISVPVPMAHAGKDDPPYQAFQDPFFDGESLTSARVDELLNGPKQPVLVWTSLFSLMKSESQPHNESMKKSTSPALEVIGESGEPAADSWSIPEEEDLEFADVAALKNKAVYVAHTPAKGLRLEDVEIPSPIEPLDLRPLSVDSVNVKDSLVHNTQLLGQVTQATSSQLVSLRSRQQQQNHLLNTLVSKVNVLSGLVGAPPPEASTSTVWQAVSELQEIKPEPDSSRSDDWKVAFMDMQQKIESLSASVGEMKREAVPGVTEKDLIRLLPEQVRNTV